MENIAIFKENEILLFSPAGGWETKIEDKYFFPIGLLYLRNYLLKHGIPSTIVDAKPLKLLPGDFKQMVRRYRPKIIGFTGNVYVRNALHAEISGIKEYAPDALVVVGGPYFTATAKECLTHLSDVDVVVRREGEMTLLELVRAFALNSGFEDIKGITYRNKSGDIIENENRPSYDRDEYEFDIRLIPDDSVYSPFVYLRNFEREKIRALPVLVARGCVRRCTFCHFNNLGRFKSRSILSIVKEIQSKRERFNCDYFWLIDPTFTLREEFVRELCEALKKHCPGIKWCCASRADCSLELLKNMAEAGCITIEFGLESGSPKVLKAIRKDLDVSLVVPFAKECKKLGIRALVFIMYSLPEETYDDFLMTMDVLHKIKPYLYDISYRNTLIFPGTQMEQQARNMNLLPGGFSWYDRSYSDVPMWKTLMSDKEIAKCSKALRDYQYLLHHSRAKYVIGLINSSFSKNRIAGRAIRKFPAIYNVLKAVSRLLSNIQ